MAARAMAAAVLRPIGSVKTRLRAGAGSCFLRAQARDCLLEHRVFADDVEKLFGRAHSAARPKARPAPSGQDDGVSF